MRTIPFFKSIGISLLKAALLAHAAPAPPISQVGVPVPMRDGIHLAANIYRPAGPEPVPAILLRTPYNKNRLALNPNWRAFVEHGYAIVLQDVRGRDESQGIFSPLVQEPDDGDDTLNWIAKQHWCNGKIGMLGGSYLGIVQWKAALTGNPHLKAIFPWVSGDDDYRDRFYSPGGALKLGHRLLWLQENVREAGYTPPDFRKYIWTLPIRQADSAATGHKSALFQTALNHPTYDSFWQAISVAEKLGKLHVPVYAVGGWFDNYVESDLEAFSAVHKLSSSNRLMIGPWPHDLKPLAGVDFGPDSKVPLRRVQFEWFDYWLKGKEPQVPDEPPLRLFVMGIDQWRGEHEWPLARTRLTKFFLSSGGRANSGGGDGELIPSPRRKEASDQFVYDPHDPMPTRGGPVCCNPSIVPWGPLDQRSLEKRMDVLVYTTAPLREDVEVTGPIQLHLYAATTALDTDFTAKLIDVYPDGMARNLTDGILRARYRNSLSKPELLHPNEVYRLKIDAGVTSNVFRKGHRIRVEISSSNFPRFDRNPNTGRPVADETELIRATQTIYHDRKHASHLLLPIIPEDHRPVTMNHVPRGVASRALIKR